MQNKDKVLRLSTAGSVDDGKSTLIGRILYDTNSIPEDRLAAIKQNSIDKAYDYLDFSMATDGLLTEREQGITIDVAHIYFSTPKRSYIIADTPGHIEYTRNMVTGTSTSQVSIILIDARNGVVEQTRRHFFINNILRTQELIIAVNKMDLIDYEEEKFYSICQEVKAMLETAEFKDQTLHFIPISALKGDNIAEPSENMPWYKEETLLDILENIHIGEDSKEEPARFNVQNIIRPRTEEYHDYRAYAGKLKSGELAVGDEVSILPSLRKSKISHISFFDQDYKRASKGSSISIQLEDDINVSRGDVIVKTAELPKSAKEISAKICWMDHKALESNSMYLMQYGVKQFKTKVKNIAYKLNTQDVSKDETATQLDLNDIGGVQLQLAQSLYFDSYDENKENGYFILIDPVSHATSAVGFIE